MIRSGTAPHKLDKRDYSLHRTFPKFGAAAPPVIPPKEYTFDAGFPMPDQNADGWEFACTGYAQAAICGDEDKCIYDAVRQYKLTCTMEGHAPDRGCDIRVSMNSLTIYGLKRQDE